MYFALVAAALILSGCHSEPLRAPEPRALELRAPADSVVIAAGQVLNNLGWTVTTGDHAGSVHLEAEHAARGDANGQWLACDTGIGATGDTRRATRDFNSTVELRLNLQPRDSTTSVRLEGLVTRAYSRMPFSTGRIIDTFVRSHCVSSGGIESAIADSLRTRFPG